MSVKLTLNQSNVLAALYQISSGPKGTGIITSTQLESYDWRTLLSLQRRGYIEVVTGELNRYRLTDLGREVHKNK